ncbi:type II toxin-antitoxin system prevent-host-death family antitoxin [Streptomyces sp. NPDC058525]|uniref:type II toxin-antitoxin system prevent-host-death family antitoxin n=1 Tax=Streptomyces sp. NPDC058525 TaxID=3346538 RepID=UPI00365C495E
MEPRTYSTIDLRKQMGQILDRTRIAGEPAAITRKGRTLAYLVPAEWFEHYQRLTRSDAVPPVGDDSEDAA